MADQKRKVLKLNRINSDGTERTGLITLNVKVGDEEIQNEDGSPAVVILLNPVQDEERRALIDECTVPERDPSGGRGMVERFNQRAYGDEMMRRAVHSWSGLAGADDKPLVCNASTKVLLDDFLRTQVLRKLFNFEAVEVLAESFR